MRIGRDAMRGAAGVLAAAVLTSCGPFYYGFLPGTDYAYYEPLERFDLKGQSFSLEFVDVRDTRYQIECSSHRLDRATELEGDLGFQYFKQYVTTMITRSHGVIDPNSPRVATTWSDQDNSVIL